MQALLTAIVTWLSINFGLPANYDHPSVIFASPTEIKLLYDRPNASAALKPSSNVLPGARPASSGHDILAAYDDAGDAILLLQNWSGTTPADLSVLVHEMVHHLQSRSGAKFACPQDRERLAFAAQEKWLGLFGKTLRSEFKIDPMTLLVRTTCAF